MTSKHTQIDKLSDFITRVTVIATVTNIKMKVEADKIKLSAYDKCNGFIISWEEEEVTEEKLQAVKNLLEENKIQFSDGDWSEENQEIGESK